MDNPRTYDVLVVGGGQTGIPLPTSWRRGMSVALAERKDLGGSCVNFGCTPTNAVIASARVAHQARRAAEYGLEIPEVRVDFPAVLQRAKEIVDLKRGGLEKGLENADNPTLIRGHARFEGHSHPSYAGRRHPERHLLDRVAYAGCRGGSRTVQIRTALHGIVFTGDHFQFAYYPVEFFDDGAVALQGAYDSAVVPERACFLAVEPRPEAFAE